MSLKGKRINQYPKQFKATNFAPARLGFVTVYEVSGTPEELEQFKAARGENHKEDEVTGKPLMWIPDGSGDDVIDLRVGRNGSVTEVNDFRTSLQQAFIEAGKLGAAAEQAVASEYGKATIAQLFASRRKASAPVITTPTPAEPAVTPVVPVVSELGQDDDDK